MSERVLTSEYMNWAKTQSRARYNLATSGLNNLLLRDLKFSLSELEITTEFGYGYPPLVELLAERMSVSSSEIVSAAGTSFANHLAMAALVNPGDEVWIEQPTYEPLLALAGYLGANIKRFQRRFEEGFQIDIDEIRQGVTSRTKLIVITNLHNPSGVLLEDERLRALGDLAAKVGCRVLVDEVYLETFFAERPQSSFSLGPQFIVTSSLTKAFGLSGLRCGWIVAERTLAERMWRLNDLFASTPVHIAERLSVAALRELDVIGTAAKVLLDRNRSIANPFFDTNPQLEVVRPDVGTIFFPRLKRGDTEAFIQTLRERYDTSVVPGRFFELPQHFRMGLGGDSGTLVEGLNRMQQALNEARGRSA